MTKHQTQVAKTRESLQMAELFLVKYESKLPEDLGDLTVFTGFVEFEVNLRYRQDNDRSKALTYLGETFGRADWNATINHDGTAFDWRKTLDGVQLSIRFAQPTDQPKSFPVDPKQFPIQLEDQP